MQWLRWSITTLTYGVKTTSVNTMQQSLQASLKNIGLTTLKGENKLVNITTTATDDDDGFFYELRYYNDGAWVVHSFPADINSEEMKEHLRRFLAGVGWCENTIKNILTNEN